MENKGPALVRIEFADNTLPVFTEMKGSDEWVLFGENNDYPAFLIELFNRSSKHNAIVTGVSEMISGDGFVIKTPAAGLDDFLQKANPFETANDVLNKVALDLKLFGGFYLQTTWSRDGKKIVELYHVPFEEIRVNKEGTKFFRYEKWTTGVNRSKPQVIEAFNPKAEKKTTQLFAYKQYRPGLKHYPLPDYIGARQYIETDCEISNFHFNNIKNNWSEGAIVSFFNGVPTQEEQQAIVAKIKAKKTGTNNAGGVTVNFADKKEQAPEVIRLQPDEMDKQYLQLYETVTAEIFIGHRITSPMLFGVRVEGQLGGRNEMMEAKELFYMSYCKPKVFIIERVWNYLLSFATGGEVYIEKQNSIDNQTTAPGQQTQVQQSKQLSEDDILMMFDSCGVPESEYRIIKQKRLRFNEDDEKPKDESFLRAFKFAVPLNIEVTEAHKKVLSTLKENPSLNEAEIANITGLPAEEVNKALNYLIDEKVLKIDGDGYAITDAGLKTIDEQNLVTTEIFVKYKYTGPKDDRNRPFCSKVLDKNKLYTREDINTISDKAGYNVWTQRGGWYHNPNTGVNTPYCRHFWSQVLVKKKSR